METHFSHFQKVTQIIADCLIWFIDSHTSWCKEGIMLKNETCKRSVSFWVKSVNKSHIPFKIPSALHHIAGEMANISRRNYCFPRDMRSEERTHYEISALVSQTSCRGETIGGIAKMSAVFLGFTSQCKRNISLTIDKNSIKRLSYYTFQ